MSQDNVIKTIIFAAAAAVCAALAMFIAPSEDRQSESVVGEQLFPDFDEIADLHSLEVVYYDTSKNQPANINVARNDQGTWSLESHKNYPADADNAEETLHNVALKLKNMKILGLATELLSEHQYYGVLEPDPNDPDQSDTGVGKMIRVTNAADKELAKVIIGKPVKKTNPNDPDQHFVRIPGQNHVYSVQIDPNDFPTSFNKWIKGDLLDINTSDITQVEFRDYTFSKQRVSTPFGVMESADEVYSPRHTITLGWNQSDWKWALNSYVEYRNGRPFPTTLLEDEELNSSKLSDMKFGLSELKIVNVEAKPPGLRADLYIDDELLRNRDLGSLLQEKGFYPRRVPNDEGGYDRQMLSSDGEVRIGMKDGVEYVLRFGKPAGITKEDGETKLNRYLLVSAQFNQNLIPAPELEDVPEPPAKKKDETDKDDPKKDEGADSEKTETESPKESDGSQDAKESSDDKDAKSADDKKDEAADDKKDDDEYEKEKKRIEADNKNKQQEYDKTVKKGQDRVVELNERFAEWYYVISEDVYKKIQLGRFDIVKEKDDAKGYGIDDFRKLQEEGLKKEEEKDDAGEKE